MNITIGTQLYNVVQMMKLSTQGRNAETAVDTLLGLMHTNLSESCFLH